MNIIMKLKFNSKLVFLMLSILVTITSSAQCNEPTSIVVNDITSISAVLNWTASSSGPGISYSFEVRTSGAPGSGATGLVDSGSVADNIVTSPISGLLTNTSYLVYMRFQCSTAPEFSSWTTAVSFVTDVLNAPTAGSAAGLSDTFFSARWIAVPGATGYRIDVSEFSDFSVLLPGYDNLFVSGGLTSKLVSGLNPSTTYYYRVRAEGNSGSGPVTSVNSNVILTTTLDEPSFVAIWTEGAWFNDIIPTADHDVILDDHFVSDENNEYMFEVKSLTLNEGFSYTLKSGYFLIVYENIVNNSSSSSFVVESNSSLFQLNDFAPANLGAITVKRNSSAIFRLDYTMWSSPVTGPQTLKQFSPQTVNSRFYSYNTASNNFSNIDPLTTTFEPGSGYLIRSPNNFVDNNGTNSPQSWLGRFIGIPTNGEINVALNTSDEGYNMVGNPYPTVISADVFLGNNSGNIDGTLYFWRRLNDSSGLGDVGSFYATYTEFGGTSSDTSYNPNGFIQVGQGFLVKATSSNLIFNSEMKVPDEFENQFFRGINSAQIEKHRIWLDLTNESGVFSKMLIGYAEGALDENDRFDGQYINDSEVALTSLINNEEYSIQAKALPFNEEDSIPLGFKITVSGEYTISLNSFDGLFQGGQSIYLEDTFTNTIHDLKEGVYTFMAENGVHNSRFVLRFTNGTLGLETTLNQNAVTVITNDRSININSGDIIMDSVIVFDIQGRKIIEKNQIDSSAIMIDTLTNTNQVLIIQIKDKNNNSVSKKVVF
jgi:hypothetical protein